MKWEKNCSQIARLDITLMIHSAFLIQMASCLPWKHRTMSCRKGLARMGPIPGRVPEKRLSPAEQPLSWKCWWQTFKASKSLRSESMLAYKSFNVSMFPRLVTWHPNFIKLGLYKPGSWAWPGWQLCSQDADKVGSLALVYFPSPETSGDEQDVSQVAPSCARSVKPLSSANLITSHGNKNTDVMSYYTNWLLEF